MKIAILLLNNNGDILYGTPIAKQIKEIDFPGCHLTWIVSNQCSDVLRNNEFIDHLEIIHGVSFGDIHANWITIENDFRKKLKEGEYDRLFILQPYDRNFLKYKSCIRRMILDAYPFPIKVPLKPILRLSEEEKSNVVSFITSNRIQPYQQKVLFEFAPSSGQANITTSEVLEIATQIVEQNSSTCVILSSKQDLLISNEHIFNAKTLTFKENAELINHCTVLLGCSSGISWISTSDYCKKIPTIQYLNSNVLWFNSLKADFQINNIPGDNILELYDYDPQRIVNTVTCFIQKGFSVAKSQYDQELKKKYLLNNFYTISDFYFNSNSYKSSLIFFFKNLEKGIGFMKYNLKIFFQYSKRFLHV